MKREETTNTFQEGMVMDFNPLVTPNNVLTNCLNGTLLTFNGNEYVLQNDMGNGRVETAFLPEGYVPLGTTELGGIVYIVSYNPLTSKCQIGSFPSPERNITNDELFNPDKEQIKITNSDFKQGDCIITPIVKKRISDIILHPGDKFIVCGDCVSQEHVSYYNPSDKFTKEWITFRLATVDNNGRVIYLDNLKKYKNDYKDDKGNKHTRFMHIKDGVASSDQDTNIDQYRKIVGSNYNIFSSKIAGGLYVIGQLEVVDFIQSFTWEVLGIKDPDSSTKGNYVNIGDSDKGKKQYEIRFNIESYSERGNVLSGIKQSHDEGKTVDVKNTSKQNSFSYTINYIASETDKIQVEVTPYMPFGNLRYLKQELELDFSYIGSNQIINNIWQYLKQSESVHIKFDINNYFINKPIYRVKLCFKELPADNSSEWDYEYELSPRKSYSGIHVVTIPISSQTIRANSLYKVSIYLDTTGEKYEDPPFTSHYLYTNGVFNEYFNSNDSNEQNFDNVYLPLIPSVKLENSVINLSYENKLLEGSSLSSKVQNTDGYIRGKTEYSAKGSKNINAVSTFEDTFDNTFSLEGVDIQNLECQEIPSIVVEKSEIINIEGDENIDNTYIKEQTELDNDNEIFDIKLNNNKLDFDIKLVSPISALSSSRDVTVQHYFAPILYKLDDFYKYCLQVTLGEDDQATLNIESITLDSTLPALGISAGGRDNQGGGGLTFVAGTANVSINTDENTEVGLLINGTSDSQFTGSGLPGINKFPNEQLSNIISSVKNHCGMVPIYLVNIGTSQIKHFNTVYKFQGSNERGKADDKKVEWFNEANYDCEGYTSALLFLKIKDSDEYIPINHFFILAYNKRESLEYPKIRAYYSLLSQLYAERPFNDTVKVFTVGKFSYLNKIVSYKNNLKVTVDYNDTNLYYNGKSITNYFGNNIPNCAKINWKDEQKTFATTLKYTFIIDNKYVDTYLEYHNSSSIPTYVSTNSADQIQAPENFISSRIYIPDNGILKLVSSQIQLPLVTLSLSQEEEYSTISITKDTQSQKFDNLDMLIYDIRDDIVCANRNKVNSSLAIYFGCHEPKFKDPTYICSKPLINDCAINKALIISHG